MSLFFTRLPARLLTTTRYSAFVASADYTVRCCNIVNSQWKRTRVTMSTTGEIVVVTGGAGFLGQHIVKHLQEMGENLKEIRVFDKKPYENLLGHKEDTPMWSIVGDLCNPDELMSAFKGANSVYHVAGLVSFGTFPDIEGMEKINVEGTRNVIQACVKQNVSRLVFCSTVDVVIGFDEIIDGNEVTTGKPEHFLFPGYPDTKHRAELSVLEANSQKLSNGEKLHTLSLRPNVMYGEGDPYFVVNSLAAAKKSGGTLYKVGNGNALFQQSYVGNVAWAFILADRALKRRPTVVGGQTFFVPDDTPIQSVFDFMHPFLTVRGFKLSKRSIPYWLLYCLMYLTETVLWIISPFVKINLNTPLCSIIYSNMSLFFNRKKAEKLLAYTPIYNPIQSVQRSIKYYMDVKL